MVRLHPGDTLLHEKSAASIATVGLDIPELDRCFHRTVTKLAATVDRFAPDVIVSSLSRSRFAARVVTRWKSIPHVECFVGDDYSPARLATLSRSEKRRARLVKLADRSSSWAFERGIALSQHLKKEVSRSLGVCSDRIVVLPRGRAPGHYQGWDRAVIRRQLDVPENAPVLISVGRLVPQKGMDVLIRAVERVKAHVPTVRLLIAGDGEQSAMLERLASALGLESNVKVLGSRADIPQLLAAADVLSLIHI